MNSSFRALVLGAAAGGGLPQWNCGCPNCAEARRPGGRIPPQTQSSLAVTGDGVHWAVLNASPDIRHQIQTNAALHPAGLRHTPISSVLLTNGDIDHLAGLLVLREKQPFTLFLTSQIAGIIRQNPVFGVLDPAVVNVRIVELGERFELAPGLTAELFCVPGKVPLYLEGETVVSDEEGEQTVGVQLSQHETAIYYIPGCARLTPALKSRLGNANVLFFDGTVFSDDEMIQSGTGHKSGRRMGHMPMTGEGGSLPEFQGVTIKRKIFIHINNTNPVWRPDSPERAQVNRAGWEIAFDGMDVSL